MNVENRSKSFGDSKGAMGSPPRGARYRYTPVRRGLILYDKQVGIRLDPSDGSGISVFLEVSGRLEVRIYYPIRYKVINISQAYYLMYRFRYVREVGITSQERGSTMRVDPTSCNW